MRFRPEVLIVCVSVELPENKCFLQFIIHFCAIWSQAKTFLRESCLTSATELSQSRLLTKVKAVFIKADTKIKATKFGLNAKAICKASHLYTLRPMSCQTACNLHKVVLCCNFFIYAFLSC